MNFLPCQRVVLTFCSEDDVHDHDNSDDDIHEHKVGGGCDDNDDNVQFGHKYIYHHYYLHIYPLL